MNGLKLISFLLSLTLIVSGIGHSVAFAGDEPRIDDLSIEQIALMTKRSAVEKLESLLNDKKQRKQKTGMGVLWVRLAEEKQQIAAIEHRVNQEKSEKLGRVYNDNRYRSQMKSTISFLDQAISSDPLSPAIGRAYFLRGKAHREVGNVPDAIRDFTKFINQFPNAGESSLVHFALGELHYSNRDFNKAIQYLAPIKPSPSFRHQSEALNILAWSYYSIGNTEKAIEYSKKEIEYYQSRIKNEHSPYLGKLERAAADYVQFYVGHLDKRPQDFSVDHVYTDLKSISNTPSVGVSEKIFESLAVQFVKVLRVKLRHEQIDQFKEKILIREKDKMVSFEVLLQTLDHQIAYQRVQSFERTLAQIESLFSGFKHPKLAESLSKNAETFTQYVQKNKGHQYEGLYRRGLNQIYSVLLKVLPKDDSRVVPLHYNIAENAFLNLNYLLASNEYRKAYELSTTADQTELKKQAELKSVASRLEALKRTDMFPKRLEVRKRSESKRLELSDDADEWMGWVQEGLNKGYTSSPWDSFAYESARLAYLSKDYAQSLVALQQFVKTFPGSTHSVSAQTLALDTLIQDQAWDEVKKVTAEFKALQGAAAPAKSNELLNQKFATIESDASFKEIEQQFDSGNMNSVFQNADQAVSSQSTWKGMRRWDVLALGLAGAIQAKDSDRSLAYSNALVAAPKDHKSRQQALKIRAESLERRLDLIPAIQGWLEVGQVDEARRIRLLELAWMTGKPDELKKILLNASICPQQDELHCDRYRALLRHIDLKQKNDLGTQKYALQKSYQSKDSTNRWLWAALAWSGVNRFAGNDQDHLQKILTNDLNNVEPRFRLGLMKGLEEGFRFRIQQIEKQYQANSALKGDILSTIDRKVKALEKLETQLSQFREYAWMPTQLESIFTLISSYDKFSAEIQKTLPPSGISEEQALEFKQVLNQIRLKADDQSKRFKNEMSEWVVSKGLSWEQSSRFAEFQGKTPHDRTLWNLTQPSLQVFQNQKLDPESKRYLSLVLMDNVPLSLEAIQRFSEVPNQDLSKVYFIKGLFFQHCGVLDEALSELAKVKSEDRIGIAAHTERLRLALQTYDPTLVKVSFSEARFLASRPGPASFSQAQIALWDYAAQFAGVEKMNSRLPSSVRRVQKSTPKGAIR